MADPAAAQVAVDHAGPVAVVGVVEALTRRERRLPSRRQPVSDREAELADAVIDGTPGGVGVFRDPPRFLTDGSVVTVEIEGIGRLTNTCRHVAAGTTARQSELIGAAAAAPR